MILTLLAILGPRHLLVGTDQGRAWVAMHVADGAFDVCFTTLDKDGLAQPVVLERKPPSWPVVERRRLAPVLVTDSRDIPESVTDLRTTVRMRLLAGPTAPVDPAGYRWPAAWSVWAGFDRDVEQWLVYRGP